MGSYQAFLSFEILFYSWGFMKYLKQKQMKRDYLAHTHLVSGLWACSEAKNHDRKGM